MKSKAPLMLIEQMVMLLVFALAAALCMQAFVRADAVSRRCEARDAAVLTAQTAAEALQGCGGRQAVRQAAALLGAEPAQDGRAFTAGYDGAWDAAQAEPVYLLEVRETDSGVAGLGRAEIRVTEVQSGETLCTLETAWQEVDADAR